MRSNGPRRCGSGSRPTRPFSIVAINTARIEYGTRAYGIAAGIAPGFQFGCRWTPSSTARAHDNLHVQDGFRITLVSLVKVLRLPAALAEILDIHQPIEVIIL